MPKASAIAVTAGWPPRKRHAAMEMTIGSAASQWPDSPTFIRRGRPTKRYHIGTLTAVGRAISAEVSATNNRSQRIMVLRVGPSCLFLSLCRHLPQRYDRVLCPVESGFTECRAGPEGDEMEGAVRRSLLRHLLLPMDALR